MVEQSYPVTSEPVAWRWKVSPMQLNWQYSDAPPVAFPVYNLELLYSGVAQSADDWQDDPAADERWNAGCTFALDQLCKFMGVDPAGVTWDAATETVDGDVHAVIGNILRAKYGEDWGPSDPAQAKQEPVDAMLALDAVEAQLYEMRSLKGWRLNLIRENLAKAKTALNVWRSPDTWKAPIETIGDLVNNLLTLDQKMKVFGAYHIHAETPDRCRARGLSLSREHVTNGRIKADDSVPYSLVIWTGADERSPSIPSTEQK